GSAMRVIFGMVSFVATVLGEQITAWLPLLDRRGAQRGRSAVELCLGSHHCRDGRQADPVSLRSTGAHSDRSAPGGGKFPNTAGDAREFESKPHPALQRGPDECSLC